MLENIEKLVNMLSAQLIAVRQSGNLQLMHQTKLEIERLIKNDFDRLVDTLNQAYIEALNGQEEAKINGWVVTYKPQERFVLDSKKLTEFFTQNLGYKEEEMKNLVYSHTLTKPSIKFKNIKS